VLWEQWILPRSCRLLDLPGVMKLSCWRQEKALQIRGQQREKKKGASMLDI